MWATSRLRFIFTACSRLDLSDVRLHSWAGNCMSRSSSAEDLPQPQAEPHPRPHPHPQSWVAKTWKPHSMAGRWQRGIVVRIVSWHGRRRRGGAEPGGFIRRLLPTIYKRCNCRCLLQQLFLLSVAAQLDSCCKSKKIRLGNCHWRCRCCCHRELA